MANKVAFLQKQTSISNIYGSSSSDCEEYRPPVCDIASFGKGCTVECKTTK